MKWAFISSGVVDTISFEDHTDIDGWIEVPDDVFGGAIQNSDGSFSHPEPEDPVPPVTPAEPYPDLDPVDFKLGMLSIDVTPDQVDAAIAGLPNPDRIIAGIYWTSARMFVRTDPLISNLGQILGKTEADINGAWVYAASLMGGGSGA